MSIDTAKIREYLDTKYWDSENGEGESKTYSYEISANYDDELSDGDIKKILGAKYDYMEVFYEILDEAYRDYEWELLKDLAYDIYKKLELDTEGYHEVKEYLEDHVFYSPDYNHFLNQTVYVNIMMDTGDGNYDYVLNSVYPHYDGEQGEEIDPKASIVWLAETQGYTKEQLENALNEGDMSKPKGFLESMRTEVANMSTHMNTVTFLVKMTLKELFELNKLIKLQEPDGKPIYDATKKPDCGYIVLDKSAECGLFDPWNGGGSVFEIELEKDVNVPIRFIRSAVPDGMDGCGVDSVYGMCESAWREVLKEVHGPEKAPGETLLAS